MLFVNHVNQPRARLLYIMGATWHTRCMFDLQTHEPSFAHLLNQLGIETFAVDILGSGPDEKPEVIGGLYPANREYISQIINEHKIDSVMGYSNGCAIAMDLAKTHQFRRIVFLDPRAQVRVNKVCVNNDKYVITKTAITQALIENQTRVDTQTAQDHIASLCAGPELVTAAWPVMSQCSRMFNDTDQVQNFLQNNSVKSFFTAQSVPAIRELFGEHGVYWPDTSHWLLLEPRRKDLAQAVAEFVVNPDD